MTYLSEHLSAGFMQPGPGRLFTFGASREDAYSGQGGNFVFEKQPNVQKKPFNIYLKTNDI